MNTKAPTDLRRGDRVLCQDPFTHSSRYLAVAAVERSPAQGLGGTRRANSLRVTFTDGTDVLMPTELMVVVE